MLVAGEPVGVREGARGHSTDTLMRQYGSASRAEGVKVRRYRASAGLALAALKW
jgi:hypothetical protein